MSRKPFSALIQEVAEREHVIQSELARRLKVRPSRVAEIFKSLNITEGLLYRCAKALGYTVEIKLVKKRSR